MLEKYTDLVSRNLSVQEAGHRTFLIDETTSISLKENISIISDGTTGLCTWQVKKKELSKFHNLFFISELIHIPKGGVLFSRVVHLQL